MKSASSNCTLPPDGANFVSSPKVRGTLDILWSCLSILLICTWSILHSNVPVQSTPGSKMQKYRRSAMRVLSKSKWMILNVAAPEWPLGKAWSDYRSVSSVEERFKAFAKRDGVTWTRTHSYFANMGGFAIRFTPSTKQLETTEASPRTNAVENRTRRSGSPAIGDAETSPETDVSRRDSALEATASTGRSRLVKSASVPAAHDSSRNPMPPDQGLRRYRSGLAADPEIGYELRGQESAPSMKTSTERNEDQSLPNSIRQQFELFKKRRLSAKKIQASLKAMSRQIGTIDWALNETNDATVSRALDTIDLKHFQGAWEKQRFVRAYRGFFNNLMVLRGDLWVLDANQILLARDLGIIDKLPDVEEDDLGDRNKGDLFVKIIAMAQIMWFLIQLAARLAKRINTSQLEILTLAYTTCTTVTYLLLLDKPKDVQFSIVLPAVRYGRPEELNRLALFGPTSYWIPRTSVWIPNNGIHADRTMDNYIRGLYQGIALAMLLFGLVHCIAWEFVFPTNAEKFLWQASSIITAVALLLAFAILFAVGTLARALWEDRVREGQNEFYVLSSTRNRVGAVIVSLSAAAFLAARVVIIVEVFRSLGFLPPEAFATTWSSNIPHIG